MSKILVHTPSLAPLPHSRSLCHTLHALGLSDAYLFFPPLSARLQVHCVLSASLMCISPFKCYISSYRCVTHSLHLWRASLLFHRYLFGYRCVAWFLPLRPASLLPTTTCPAIGALHVLYLSNVHLHFPPLSLQLQVYCQLSTSPSRICTFHRYLSGHRCVASSLPL